ncbi:MULTISPECIES: MFS transporter [unclassified Sphingomonas]|uniref:MFS transporter n=2 Tax=unclassified Sphingomonas TaxID=196159 RepID=UPI0022B5B885|nr:MFS transporter [Sphingomonas sp. NIBR02145]WHU02923.1 MFS transporter [Sphingomonas sp. NIBR02145]
MHGAALGLMRERRFLPLFVTQFLGAFNDNLFKNAMIFFATYQIFNSVEDETRFSAIATGIFILPFFLFSALAGQLADSYDKAKIMRIIKAAEIGIMLVGASGIFLKNLELMLVALVGMGVHSAFFGPIKYAILPQHLKEDEVLGGTGMVEAGTYIAILCGTIAGGVISAKAAAFAVIGVALVGWLASQRIPSAPPLTKLKIDYNIFRASWRLISATMHIRRLYLAIIAISVFWTIAAVLGVLFPPLVKNVFHAQKDVASVFLGIFSVGIAIGSVIINRLLKGHVSAKYAVRSVLSMMLFVICFYLTARFWPVHEGPLLKTAEFLSMPIGWAVLGTLLAIATTGGMFVVPLYAFLTTTVEKSQTARTVAANNIVNSGFMVFGSVGIFGVSKIPGVGVAECVLVVVLLCLASAWCANRLYKAEDTPHAPDVLP